MIHEITKEDIYIFISHDHKCCRCIIKTYSYFILTILYVSERICCTTLAKMLYE